MLFWETLIIICFAALTGGMLVWEAVKTPRTEQGISESEEPDLLYCIK